MRPLFNEIDAGMMSKGPNRPIVSAIIPSYNRGWIIREAIESVLSQGFKDFELIVVDDGSTDETSSILLEYRDSVSIIRQENRGVSAARNRGIKEARGELVAFLDSDDLWTPSKLDAQVRFFKEHPDAVICQTEEIWIRNGVRVNPGKRHKKPSGDIFTASLELCLVSPSAVMVKKSLFDEVGFFDENMVACEDYDLWLRIACLYPVYLIPDFCVIKRGGHPDQLSRRPGLDRLRIYSIIKLLKSGKLSRPQKEAAVSVLKKKCEIYASGCKKRGRFCEADYFTRLSSMFE